MSQIDDDELTNQEARDAIRALKELQESPGWRILSRIAEAQVKARTDAVMLSPRGDMKTEWDHEFKKGEVSGMRLILSLPSSHLDLLEAQKEIEDVRNADATADDSDADGSSAADIAADLARGFAGEPG